MPTDEDADPCGFRPARCSVYKFTVPYRACKSPRLHEAGAFLSPEIGAHDAGASAVAAVAVFPAGLSQLMGGSLEVLVYADQAAIFLIAESRTCKIHIADVDSVPLADVCKFMESIFQGSLVGLVSHGIGPAHQCQFILPCHNIPLSFQNLSKSGT